MSCRCHQLAAVTVCEFFTSSGGENGKVTIVWEPEVDDRRFRFEWRERDGPPVRPPSRRGFGSRLLEQGLAHDLAGKVRLIFDRPGLVCIIEAPLNEVGQREWRAAAAN